MASVRGGEPNWREARERLLSSLHEAGIETGSPLGSILLQQFDSTAAADARLEAAARAVEGARSDAVAELAELKQQLQEGCRQVQELKQSGETHLRFQEKLMERERESAIHRFIKELTKDLQQVVFKELKEKLPLEERRFYYYAAWRRIFLAFVAAGLIGGLGFVGGSREPGKIYQLGVICQQNLRYDPKKNIDWCPVTLPTSSTAGQSG